MALRTQLLSVVCEAIIGNTAFAALQFGGIICATQLLKYEHTQSGRYSHIKYLNNFNSDSARLSFQQLLKTGDDTQITSNLKDLKVSYDHLGYSMDAFRKNEKYRFKFEIEETYKNAIKARAILGDKHNPNYLLAAYNNLIFSGFWMSAHENSSGMEYINGLQFIYDELQTMDCKNKEPLLHEYENETMYKDNLSHFGNETTNFIKCIQAILKENPTKYAAKCETIKRETHFNPHWEILDELFKNIHFGNQMNVNISHTHLLTDDWCPDPSKNIYFIGQHATSIKQQEAINKINQREMDILTVLDNINFNNEKQKIDKHCKDATKIINDSFDEIINIANDSRNAYLNKIKKIKNKQHKTLFDQQQKLTNSSIKLTECKQSIESLLQDNSLDNYDKKKQIISICNQTLNDCHVTNEKIDKVTIDVNKTNLSFWDFDINFGVGDIFDLDLINTNLELNKNCLTKTGGWSGNGYLKNIIEESGIYHWQFKIKKINERSLNEWSSMIGIADANTMEKLSPFTDRGDKGYGYSYSCGKLTAVDEYGLQYDQYGVKCRENDVIDMYCNMDKLELRFSVNHIDQGVAFENIKKINYRAAVYMWFDDESIELTDYTHTTNSD